MDLEYTHLGMSADEYAASTVEPPARIIGPIRAATENWYIAPTGAGKTFFAHAVAGSAGAGLFMSDWVCTNRHKVTIVDGEMPEWGLKGVINTLISPNAYRIIASHQQEQPINLMDRAHQDWLFDEIKDQDLVIFDNLVTLFHPDTDRPSASAEYALEVSQFYNRLRNAGVALISFDHPGKDGKTAFGSSRQHITADLVGHMDRSEEVGVDMKVAGFRLSYIKTRGEFNPTYHIPANWELCGGRWGQV
jgi:hypothetical protein